MRQQAALFITGVDEDSVRRVFNHWKEVLRHPRVQLEIANFNIIAERLKTGYTEEDLMLAIEGCSRDPWIERRNHTGLADVFKPANMARFMQWGEDARIQAAAIARKHEEAERKKQEEASRPRLQITPDRVAQLSQFRKVG